MDNLERELLLHLLIRTIIHSLIQNSLCQKLS